MDNLLKLVKDRLQYYFPKVKNDDKEIIIHSYYQTKVENDKLYALIDLGIKMHIADRLDKKLDDFEQKIIEHIKEEIKDAFGEE